jgi:hypothetical protein
MIAFQQNKVDELRNEETVRELSNDELDLVHGSGSCTCNPFTIVSRAVTSLINLGYSSGGGSSGSW